jgi:hypothetical protein
LKTTDTVGVAPPLSCAMHAVLSLQQRGQGQPPGRVSGRCRQPAGKTRL